mgnify:CR=1 FL=1
MDSVEESLRKIANLFDWVETHGKASKDKKPTENKQSDFVCVIHTFICFNAPKVSLSFVTTKKKVKI